MWELQSESQTVEPTQSLSMNIMTHTLTNPSQLNHSKLAEANFARLTLRSFIFSVARLCEAYFAHSKSRGNYFAGLTL
jgi:hypothetical protein